MDGEKWLPIVGHEGRYDVSNYGRVKRIAPGRGAVVGLVLTPILSKGYPCVNLLCGAGEKRIFAKVHRLVAVAFLGEPPSGCVVNHIDGDPSNSHVSNLEYCTQADNMRHAARMGLLAVGSQRKNSKLTEREASLILSLSQLLGVSNQTLGDVFGISPRSVSDIVNRITWKHVEPAPTYRALAAS